MKLMVLTNGEFETKEITNELEDLQKIVGGYIEIPYLKEIFTKNAIDVIINEEGKFNDEEGNTIELNEEQYKVVMEELSVSGMINYKGNPIEVKALFI